MDIIRQQVWSIDDTCWWRSIGAFKNIRMHIIIKQEGDKNEEELKKGHGIIYGKYQTGRALSWSSF